MLRIGVLGAARIVGRGVVKPARAVPDVTVAGIAARDPRRARQHAKKLNILTVFDSYDALLASPDIDAVYIALPNALHKQWTVRALEAGKHVLCEKPVTSNEKEAIEIAEVTARTGLTVGEAMHPVYHGLWDVLRKVLDSGVLGEVRRVTANAAIPVLKKDDIRWQYELGGGALMDMGGYATTVLRLLAGAEPAEITSASATLRTAEVDRRMDATIRFRNGVTGSLMASMWSWPPLSSTATVEGSLGKLTVRNPYAPQFGSKVDISIRGAKPQIIRTPKLPDTYTGQLRAFAAAVLHGQPLPTGPGHFIPNMSMIDDIYRRAGLSTRGA